MLITYKANGKTNYRGLTEAEIRALPLVQLQEALERDRAGIRLCDIGMRYQPSWMQVGPRRERACLRSEAQRIEAELGRRREAALEAGEDVMPLDAYHAAQDRAGDAAEVAAELAEV